MNWKHIKSYKNDTCDRHKLEFADNVIYICETERRASYVLRWHRGATLELQKPFEAINLHAAKAYALEVVRNAIQSKAAYWTAMLNIVPVPPAVPQEEPVKLSKAEFVETYCLNCGSQRGEGIGTDWFEGCQHKNELAETEETQNESMD